LAGRQKLPLWPSSLVFVAPLQNNIHRFDLVDYLGLAWITLDYPGLPWIRPDPFQPHDKRLPTICSGLGRNHAIGI
jgi:hypothetical protein